MTKSVCNVRQLKCTRGDVIVDAMNTNWRQCHTVCTDEVHMANVRQLVTFRTCIHAVQKPVVTNPVNQWPALSVGYYFVDNSRQWILSWAILTQSKLSYRISLTYIFMLSFHLTPRSLKWSQALRQNTACNYHSLPCILEPSQSDFITLRIIWWRRRR